MGDFERELLGSSYTKAKVVTMKNNARGHRGWNCAKDNGIQDRHEL